MCLGLSANKTVHNDLYIPSVRDDIRRYSTNYLNSLGIYILYIPSVRDEIKRYSKNYLNRLSIHPHMLAITLLDESNKTNRLRRQHDLDLSFV